MHYFLFCIIIYATMIGLLPNAAANGFLISFLCIIIRVCGGCCNVPDSGIKIFTATELSYTDYSAELNLLIENNSDKNLSFISGSMGYSCNAVNGYMVNDGYLNAAACCQA